MGTRTRSKTTTGPTYITARATTTSGLPVAAPYNQDQTYGSGGTIGYNNVITDESHADYVKRRNRGEIIMGALSMSKWSRDFSPSTVTVTIPSWGNEKWTWKGDLAIGLEMAVNRIGKLPDTIGDVSLVKNAAVIKAYAKINSSNIMSGEVLSDLGKTVSMLKDPFSNASSLVKKMTTYKMKRLKKSGVNAIQATSDAWLEHSYAWTPIFSDIGTIVKESHRIRASAEQSIVVRASEVYNNKFNASVANAAGTDNTSGFLYDGTCTSQIDVSAHCGIIVRIVNLTTSQSLLKFFGLRFEDLPSLVWEKTPYSFVVDQFLGVGDWIKASVPDPNVTITRSWVTTKYQKYNYFSGKCYRILGGVTSSKVDCSSVVTHHIITRILDPGIPPLPVVKVNSLSLHNILDDTALLTRPIIAGIRKLCNL